VGSLAYETLSTTDRKMTTRDEDDDDDKMMMMKFGQLKVLCVTPLHMGNQFTRPKPDEFD